uniref:Uncharacterized protein n=1 Tax=Amphimedon queenslandica TaxID=400682 RepID=A0A1X7TWN7_AMPQE
MLENYSYNRSMTYFLPFTSLNINST